MISQYYAVLAPVSRRYPPVQGRLLTRYSPVRHYPIVNTQRINSLCPFMETHHCYRGSFLLWNVPGSFNTLSANDRTVRLACVRHAASVRPEPGSNPQINYLSVCPLMLQIILGLSFQCLWLPHAIEKIRASCICTSQRQYTCVIFRFLLVK